jgi:hypothetical protein
VSRPLRGTALALLLALAVTASACSDDESGEPQAPVRTTDPVRTFAPVVRLHPEERYFPIAAHEFIEWASVTWEDPTCGDETISIGGSRLAADIDDEDVPATQPARLGPSAPYRHAPRAAGCEGRRAQRFRADQLTRPFDPGERPAGLPDDQGFYLDIATDMYEGHDELGRAGAQAVLRGVPAYFERTRTKAGGPGTRITYWLLFAVTKPPEDRDAYVASHEGGWERVSVLLRNSGPGRYVPRSVEYHARRRQTIVPWADVERAGGAQGQTTHPVAYAARGGHALYPDPERRTYDVTIEGRRTTYADDVAPACADCPEWRTWQLLRDVRAQPWYGFGGAWGLTYAGTDTTGPLGPSRYRPPNGP